MAKSPRDFCDSVELVSLVQAIAPASAAIGAGAFASMGGGATLSLSASMAARALRATSSQLRRLAIARLLCFMPASGLNLGGIDIKYAWRCSSSSAPKDSHRRE